MSRITLEDRKDVKNRKLGSETDVFNNVLMMSVVNTPVKEE